MSKELERIKVYVQEQTAELAENVRAELLDALAWWASEEAGSLNFESPEGQGRTAGRPGMVGERGSREPQFRVAGRRKLRRITLGRCKRTCRDT